MLIEDISHLRSSLCFFCYKIKYAKNLFSLLGNHEYASINLIHGFYDEVRRYYNIKLWKIFSECFNYLAIAKTND